MALGRAGLAPPGGGGGGGTTIHSYADIAALRADVGNRSDDDIWSVSGSSLRGVFTGGALAIEPLEMGRVPSRFLGEHATHGVSYSGDVTQDGNGDWVISVAADTGDNSPTYLPDADANNSELRLNAPILGQVQHVVVRLKLDYTSGNARFGVIVHDEGGDNPHVGVALYDGAGYNYKVTGPGGTGYASASFGSVTVVDERTYVMSFALNAKATGTGRIFGQIHQDGAAGDAADYNHNMEAGTPSNDWKLRIWAAGGIFSVTVLDVSFVDPSGELQS